MTRDASCHPIAKEEDAPPACGTPIPGRQSRQAPGEGKDPGLQLPGAGRPFRPNATSRRVSSVERRPTPLPPTRPAPGAGQLMDSLVRLFHGARVKADYTFDDMEDELEFFDAPPSLRDLSCRVREKFDGDFTLKGRFDCGKIRANYVLMSLPNEAHWLRYKKVVAESNVSILEVVVENGRRKKDLQSVGGIGGDEEDGAWMRLNETCQFMPPHSYTANEVRQLRSVHVHVPSVPNYMDISMTDKAVCDTGLKLARESVYDPNNEIISKGMVFSTLNELKSFLQDYALKHHSPYMVMHSDQNQSYTIICKQGCLWKLWAHRKTNDGKWRITNVLHSHTCGTSDTQQYCHVHHQRDCSDVGYTPNVLPTNQKRQRRQ